MALQEGSILNDRYRIDGQLGKGGMGAVYRAYDQTLQIKVAVKENLNLNPESERQFKREASLLAGLRHPNLPRVTDHFILEGRQYLVMDFIEGEDLHARAKRQPPTVPEVLRWTRAVADALSYLHSREPPIIHRDIKPANIKLSPEGNVVLVDFGLAKVFDHQQTTTGARGLTPGYSPPEQYGSGRTDARSDQYAVAATMFALLTGQAPIDSIERMMGNAELRRPSSLNPSIPDYIDEALTIALSISKDDRFPDIKTFDQALRGEVAARTVIGRAPDVTRAKPEEGDGRPVWLWAALGIAGLFVVGLVSAGAVFALSGGLPGAANSPAPTATNAPAAVAATATDPPTSTPSPTQAPAATPTVPPTEIPLPTVPASTRGGGGRIAFVSDRDDGRTLQIWTMDAEGDNPHQLTFGPGNKSYPTWSPDGRRLLFVAPGGTDDFGNDLALDIWVINQDGTEIKNVTHHPGDDTEPAWAPDGSTILFTSDRVNDLRQVFRMDAACLDEEEGACWDVNPTNLSQGFAVEYSPAWSPNGRTIAVSASINSAPGRIYLRSPVPGDPTRLDSRDRILGAQDLTWSPDGQLLAFTWVQPTMNEIYVVDGVNRGAEPTKLTNSLGNKEPAYSPDSQWIVFTSTRDQDLEIYIMTANGSNEVNLTNSPTSRDQQASWQPLP